MRDRPAERPGPCLSRLPVASQGYGAADHANVADRETANRIKNYWSDRFDVLGEVLGSSRA